MPLAVARPIQPGNSVKCWLCPPGTAAWTDPHVNMALCPRHWKDRLARFEGEDKREAEELIAYSEATGDNSGRKVAEIIMAQSKSMRGGDTAPLRIDPRHDDRRVGFDRERFNAWRKTRPRIPRPRVSTDLTWET